MQYHYVLSSMNTIRVTIIRDDLSRSALELALMSNHSAVVAILLPRVNIVCTEEALMYVIEKENVKVGNVEFNT